VKIFEDMFSRFDKRPASDGQTDSRTRYAYHRAVNIQD